MLWISPFFSFVFFFSSFLFLSFANNFSLLSFLTWFHLHYFFTIVHPFNYIRLYIILNWINKMNKLGFALIVVMMVLILEFSLVMVSNSFVCLIFCIIFYIKNFIRRTYRWKHPLQANFAGTYHRTTYECTSWTVNSCA